MTNHSPERSGMNVALYARVSSERQEVDLSISSQLRALREYSLRHDFQIVREFVEEAESGRTANRPAFQEMISLARRRPLPFQAILVWKFSRFSRNREDSIIYKSLLRRQGVQIISINEQVEEGPTGRMLEGIIEVVDEFYSANLAQEVVRGMREAASRGFWVQPMTPYGYRRIKVPDGSKQRVSLEPESTTAPVVRQIFQMALQGKGTKEITTALNDRGIPSPAGKQWSKSRIHAILCNPVYKGTLQWGVKGKFHREAKLDPIVIEGALPALVQPKEFEQVQSQLRSRAPAVIHPRRLTSPYLLSGLLRCGGCGAKMYGHGAKSGQFHYYVCGTKTRTGNRLCSQTPVPQVLLERLVLSQLRSLLLREEHVAELVELTNEELRSQMAGVGDQILALEGQQGEIRRRLDRLYDALESSDLDVGDLAPRIKDHRERLDLVQRAIGEAEETKRVGHQQLISRTQVMSYINGIQETLGYGSITEQRQAMRAFVKAVVLEGDRVRVEYTLPMPPEDEPTVLDIVMSGGRHRTRTCDPFRVKQVL